MIACTHVLVPEKAKVVKTGGWVSGQNMLLGAKMCVAEGQKTWLEGEMHG